MPTFRKDIGIFAGIQVDSPDDDSWRIHVDNDGTVKTENVTDGGALLCPKARMPFSFETYDAEPGRNSEGNVHGGLDPLVTGDTLNSGSPITVTKGTGKMVIMALAGSDVTGSITVTGDTIDRNTGVKTVGDTNVLTVDALSTDASSTDGNGNSVHDLANAYITSKWFTGSVTISTTDVTLTDVDVYHVSFEQFDGASNVTLDSLDVNLVTTNNSAEFDAYLYTLKVTGDKCDIASVAELHLGTDGETAIADKYWRLRAGHIDETLDGSTDGIWVDTHYSNAPAYIEDVTLKVWATNLVDVVWE